MRAHAPLRARPQVKHLLHQAGGDPVHVVAHVLSAGAGLGLHAKLGPLLEAAEQLGARSEAQLLQARACGGIGVGVGVWAWAWAERSTHEQ